MACKEVSQNLEYKYLSIKEKTAIQLEKLREIPSKKILIDGLAGVGKGTLVSKLAKDLNLKLIKTGDMYRAISWYLLESGFEISEIRDMDEEKLRDILAQIEIEFNSVDSSWEINHPNIKKSFTLGDEHLRSPEVKPVVSKVACRDAVRDLVDKKLREIVENNKNVASEGRDMYQVFAEDRTGLTMIYMFASERDLMLREKGRQKDLTEKDISIYDSAEVLRRNEEDNEKERGKLLLPGEMNLGNYDLAINNSGLEIEETYLLVLESLVTLNEVQTKIDEILLLREKYFEFVADLSVVESEDMKDVIVFIAIQWGVIYGLMEEFNKDGGKNVGKVLLNKLELYRQSLDKFFQSFLVL